MAFSLPTFLAVVLTLLALGVMSGTQANPVEQSGTPNDLEITKDDKPIENGAVVQGTEGEEFELICIVQGVNPPAVSWWEGGAELESVAYKSTYATSNVLSVKAITVDDSRRTFTCRSLNGQLSKTVTLEVHEVPVLDITSSIKLDKPIFGDKFGPFTAGQELTLICSTKASDSVSLSWWEGDTEQQSSAKVDDGLISSSFTIQTLRIKDNGRRFSCKDQQTQAIKHFEISVETDPTNVMEITKDGESIKDGAVVRGIAGQDFTLICIVQGYNPLAVSWWEGGAELESVAYKSTYATSNVLSVKAITVDDSRRTFTCRSLNGQLSKTVTLEVDEEMFITQASTSGALVLTIVLLVLLVLFIVSLLVMVVLIFKNCANKKVVEGRKDEVSNGNQVFSAVVKDNSLGKVSNEKKYNKLINNSNESVSEHEEV